MILIKSFLKGVLYDHFKPKYMDLNERDKVCKCCSYFKLMIQSNLYVCLFKTFFVEHISLKRLYWYIKPLQSSTFLNEERIMDNLWWKNCKFINYNYHSALSHRPKLTQCLEMFRHTLKILQQILQHF